jgi:hypothetical protein
VTFGCKSRVSATAARITSINFISPIGDSYTLDSALLPQSELIKYDAGEKHEGAAAYTAFVEEAVPPLQKILRISMTEKSTKIKQH